MGMQAGARGLLGVHGDADATVLYSGSCGAESRAQARRILAPQSEYPILTPGFLEVAAADSQRRTSFQESDGYSIWKEIYTDTQSTAGHSTHSLSFEPGHLRTPSVSTATLQNSPYADYMESPALRSPTTSDMTSNYFPDTTPLPARNYNSPNSPHSPQNVNAPSPQLRPLEKSPKRTPLHIASPRLIENGGLPAMVNQLTLSAEPQQPTRTDYDLPSTMPPPATSMHQVALSSSTASSMKLKKTKKKTTNVRDDNQSVRGMSALSHQL